MKFQDKETAEVLDDISKVADRYCMNHDCFWQRCPMEEATKGEPCGTWAKDHPQEAAALIGYEVVEDSKGVEIDPVKSTDGPSLDEAIDKYLKIKGAKMDKPMEEWTLGELKDYCYRAPHDCIGCKVKGDRNNCPFDGEPAKWNLDEKPRFTEQEVEDAKTLLRIFPEQLESISCANDGTVTLQAKGAWRCHLNSNAFPSLKPGETITIDEIIGGAE